MEFYIGGKSTNSDTTSNCGIFNSHKKEYAYLTTSEGNTTNAILGTP